MLGWADQSSGMRVNSDSLTLAEGSALLVVYTGAVVSLPLGVLTTLFLLDNSDAPSSVAADMVFSKFERVIISFDPGER